MAEQVVRGATRLKRRLDTIRKAAREVVTDQDGGIKSLLIRRNLERFDRAVNPDEIPWEPLDDSTVRRKAGKGFAKPNQPLFATGTLRKSIGVIRGGSAVIAVSSGAGFRIGIANQEADYGRFHQLGIGVPERKFLGINAKDVKAVDSLLRRAMIRATSKV
jgi:phage gpG-like protein